jgi:hypothetical protein
MAQAVSRRPPTAEARVRSVHVGFVVDKVALGQVFLRVLRFSPVNFIPPVPQYYEKDKENNNHNRHLHHRVAQEASRLRCFRNVSVEIFSRAKNIL